MRRIAFTLSALCFTLSVGAQDLISKIPSTATAVATIKGKQITDMMSVDNFSNTELGKLLGKNLSKETDGKIKNLKDLGFDIENNFYYFLEVNNNVFTNCFLFPLENPNGFVNLLSEREKEKIVTEGSYSYIQDEYDGTVTLWNNNTLLLLLTKDQSKEDYGYYDDWSHETYAEEVKAADVAEEIVEIEEAAVEAVEEESEEVIYEAVEAPEIEVPEIEEAAEEVVYVEEAIEETNENYYDSEAYKKEQQEREKKRLEHEAKRKERKRMLAKSSMQKAKTIMAGNYVKGSILKNPAYVKSIGKGTEEASVWINDFMEIYKQSFPSYIMGGAMNPYSFLDIDKIYKGVSLAAKLDFEEDHAAIKTVYTMSNEMADLYRPMYDGNFNKNFTKYLNEDKMLGYMSINLSTEGILTAYPNLMDKMFKTGEKESIAEAVSIGARLFSILIDEKAAAGIVRGDMLLALTDIKERQVTYTDYEYDKDYNYTEVEKTKTETVPDFLFMFSSEEKNLFDRLVRIGVKENELAGVNGSMYKAIGLGKSSPFDIYLMFKENTVFVGSSLEHMTQISNNTFVSKLSSVHKKNLRKSATSMFINGKKIISEIPNEAYPRELRDKVQFLTDNTEDIQFNFEKIKGNTMKGEMIWRTPENGHKNSFVYFVNMIDALMK